VTIYGYVLSFGAILGNLLIHLGQRLWFMTHVREVEEEKEEVASGDRGLQM